MAHTYEYAVKSDEDHDDEDQPAHVKTVFMGNPDLSGMFAVGAPPEGVPLTDGEQRLVQIPGVTLMDFVGDCMKREAVEFLEDVVVEDKTFAAAPVREMARLDGLTGEKFLTELSNLYKFMWSVKTATNTEIHISYASYRSMIRGFAHRAVEISQAPDQRGSRRDIETDAP